MLKKSIRGIAFTAFMLTGSLAVMAVHGQQSPAKTASGTASDGVIRKLLVTYQDALNASDLKSILPLYAENAAFLPSGGPAALGIGQIKAAYDAGIKIFKLNIRFHIEKIEVSGDLAFASTTSQGTMLFLANHKTVPESNRELFVFKKENGRWRILRYMFNMATQQ